MGGDGFFLSSFQIDQKFCCILMTWCLDVQSTLLSNVSVIAIIGYVKSLIERIGTGLGDSDKNCAMSCLWQEVLPDAFERKDSDTSPVFFLSL